MAKLEAYIPSLLKHEGGFVNDPTDRGGATKYGVTLATWKAIGKDKDGDGDIDAEDIKILTVEDFAVVVRKYYWNRWNADLINSQSVANVLVDWTYNSGSYGITIPQRVLGLKPDGIVGAKTLDAVNSQDPFLFFLRLQDERKTFFKGIVERDPKQVKFLQGWLNRLESFKFVM